MTSSNTLRFAILALSILSFATLEKSVAEQREYLEKGTLHLTATDYDGWASVLGSVYRWDDLNRKWVHVTNNNTSDGRCAFSLSPGVYQLKMYYREASPQEERIIEGIQIGEKTVVEKEEYFEKGTLRLTATDYDGWASVLGSVDRWDDLNRKWVHVTNNNTSDGRCAFSLSPGVYQLKMYYREASPQEERIIEGIQIGDKTVVEKEEYFEKGTLRLTATDYDGWASVLGSVDRWDDLNRKWVHVTNNNTSDGRCAFSLSPGVYQLKMYYREASPQEERIIEGIQIGDKTVVEKKEYFEKGTLRLTATDYDGWASVLGSVDRWDDLNRKWVHVTNNNTSDGRCAFSLSPGVYQLKMYYREASPQEERIIDCIQIGDKTVVEKEEYFEKGTLRLTATDYDGWASVLGSVYRWDDQNRKWVHVTNNNTSDGRCAFSLSPGVYQLKMYYREASPQEERIIEGIHVVDRHAISLGEQFGGGNLPPIISASGPYEIGDGDGFYEMGERVIFRISINDSDIDSIDFLLNDRNLRTIRHSGKFEQIIKLSVPGEYSFAVRARDKNGKLESYGRTIPVSMQKKRSKRAAKYLPEKYGTKHIVRKCPKCAKEYAQEIAYCPDDGLKLNPIEKIIYGILDAGLLRSGIAPTSKIAQDAKKLGLNWLNPFADPNEINEDIQRLVDDIVNRD